MDWTDFVPSDIPRLMFSVQNLSEYYFAFANAWWAVPSCLIACGLLLIAQSDRMREDLSAITVVPSMAIYKKFGDWRKTKMDLRTKRIKQAEELEENLGDFIETKVASGDWTRLDANEWYSKHIHIFPNLRHSIWKPQDVKEAISERIRNQDRDAAGNVIPVPLPQEVSTQVK